MQPADPGSSHDMAPSAPLRPAVSTGGGRARSAIPLVIGILGIVFSVLGILASVLMSFGLAEELDAHGVAKSDLGAFGTWMDAAMIPSLVVFALHLTAGIMSIAYKRSAPLLMTLYAILALVLVGTDIGLSIALFQEPATAPIFDDLVGPRIGFGILAAPWPIVALILMNVPPARAACTR